MKNGGWVLSNIIEQSSHCLRAICCGVQGRPAEGTKTGLFFCCGPLPHPHCAAHSAAFSLLHKSTAVLLRVSTIICLATNRYRRAGTINPLKPGAMLLPHCETACISTLLLPVVEGATKIYLPFLNSVERLFLKSGTEDFFFCFAFLKVRKLLAKNTQIITFYIAHLLM